MRDTLPDRRVEAWKYSDLRAALGDAELPQLDAGLSDAPIIARLAGGFEEVALAAGEQRVRLERITGEGLQAQAQRFVLAPGARLTRVVLQSGPGIGLSLAQIELAAGARFQQFTLGEGGRLARIETHVAVQGEGAEVELMGVYLAANACHIDLTSQVVHQMAHGRTNQLIKGAARAGGRGVFQGKILVARGAQKTDARQHHQALLLEEGAEVYAKPELEIYADDVACAHGNTAGALSQEQLFYLRTRAIPRPQAEAMLTQAFLMEAVPEWLEPALHDEIEARITAWLGAAQ